VARERFHIYFVLLLSPFVTDMAGNDDSHVVSAQEIQEVREQMRELM
jgi:hypothetical protein